MATGSERAWLLPQTDGCLEIRLESGLKWLLPAGTSNRSSLLSGLLEEGSVHEVWVPEGMVDAWLALLSLDATSKRALSSEHLLLYTQVRVICLTVPCFPLSFVLLGTGLMSCLVDKFTVTAADVSVGNEFRVEPKPKHGCLI